MSLAHQLMLTGIAARGVAAANSAGIIRYERMVQAIAEAKAVDERRLIWLPANRHHAGAPLSGHQLTQAYGAPK
jgi:hypothetical protein